MLTKYQTALDNQLYRAMKILRDAQEWRMKPIDAIELPDENIPADAVCKKPKNFVGEFYNNGWCLFAQLSLTLSSTVLLYFLHVTCISNRFESICEE